MTANLTKKEFVKWIKQSIGKQYNFDGWFGLK